MAQKAEGKKVPKEANPYSFKNFTATRETSSSPPFPDVLDNSPLPSSTPKDPSGAAQYQPDIFEKVDKKKPATTVKEENPFSFFKYVKEEGSRQTSPAQPPFPAAGNSPKPAQSQGSGAHHHHHRHQSKNGSKPQTAEKDHDFDDDFDDVDDPGDANLSDGSFDDDHSKVPQRNFGEQHVLPVVNREDSDFSDDDAVPIVAKAAAATRSHNLAELEAKNAELREEIQRQRSRADGAEKRAAAIERKFEAFRDKERKETAVLEKMVQDVEESLKLSNTRALAAEANAARLQQELNKALAELQAERLSRAGAGTTTPSDFGPFTQDNIADIHNRANMASQELKALSENARNAIQMLLASTNALERCSFSLKNLEKVTEIGIPKSGQGKGAN